MASFSSVSDQGEQRFFWKFWNPHSQLPHTGDINCRHLPPPPATDTPNCRYPQPPPTAKWLNGTNLVPLISNFYLFFSCLNFYYEVGKVKNCETSNTIFHGEMDGCGLNQPPLPAPLGLYFEVPKTSVPQPDSDVEKFMLSLLSICQYRTEFYVGSKEGLFLNK